MRQVFCFLCLVICLSVQMTVDAMSQQDEKEVLAEVVRNLDFGVPILYDDELVPLSRLLAMKEEYVMTSALQRYVEALSQLYKKDVYGPCSLNAVREFFIGYRQSAAILREVQALLEQSVFPETASQLELPNTINVKTFETFRDVYLITHQELSAAQKVTRLQEELSALQGTMTLLLEWIGRQKRFFLESGSKRCFNEASDTASALRPKLDALLERVTAANAKKDTSGAEFDDLFSSLVQLSRQIALVCQAMQRLFYCYRNFVTQIRVCEHVPSLIRELVDAEYYDVVLWGVGNRGYKVQEVPLFFKALAKTHQKNSFCVYSHSFGEKSSMENDGDYVADFSNATLEKYRSKTHTNITVKSLMVMIPSSVEFQRTLESFLTRQLRDGTVVILANNTQAYALQDISAVARAYYAVKYNTQLPVAVRNNLQMYTQGGRGDVIVYDPPAQTGRQRYNDLLGVLFLPYERGVPVVTFWHSCFLDGTFSYVLKEKGDGKLQVDGVVGDVAKPHHHALNFFEPIA